MNAVILTFMTNLLIDGLTEEANDGSITQLFLQLFTQNGGIFSFCQSFATVRVFIAPPNIRTRPSWFPRLRPSIIRLFHQFLRERPANLQILSDYSGELDPDGIHFNIWAGVNFVKGLADQVTELMQTAPPDPKTTLVLNSFLI